MNETVKINGISGEYKIESVQNLEGKFAEMVESAGKEAKWYHLAKVLKNGKTSITVVVCYRFKESGNFVRAI